jgi:hypothetical protein
LGFGFVLSTLSSNFNDIQVLIFMLSGAPILNGLFWLAIFAEPASLFPCQTLADIPWTWAMRRH